MKTIITVLIVLLMIPMASYSMEEMTEDSLDSVTGQAGVSIMIDEVEVYWQIGDLAFTDTDAGGGTFGFGEITMHISINAIGGSVDPTKYGLTEADVRPLTIDVVGVGSLPGTDTSAALVIGLPTCEIIFQETVLKPYIGDPTNDQIGDITIGDWTIAILGGTLEIANH